MEADGQELFGRGAETARLRDFLDTLPASGGALVLRGDPGIGRSSLARWAGAQAGIRGVRVVACTAADEDSPLPYAGLRPLVSQLPRGGLATAISAGLPLAKVAPLLLAAVVAVADRQPALLVVDDAQWLDQASWTALTFVARRLTHDPASVLLAMREGAVTSARLPGSGLAELLIEPLAAEAARELLARRVPGLGPEPTEQVLARAGGNPLGLVELGMAAAAGSAPVGELPLPVRLERAFARDVGRLPERARTLVQVAALNDGPDGDEIVAAARRLDPAVSDDDFGPAVAERLVEVTDGFRIGFRHPLVRSAVGQIMATGRRQQIHQALSVVLAGHPTRQIWHRASAASAPDAQLAADLADSAEQAHRRGAMGSAAQAYERAAQLTRHPETEADLVLSAAYSAHQAGDSGTVRRLLARLADRALPPATQARHALIGELVDGDVWSGPEPMRHYLGIIAALARHGETDLAVEGLEIQAYNLFYADPDQATRDLVVEMMHRLPTAADDPRRLCVLGLVAPVEHYAAVLPAVRLQAAALTARPAQLHRLALAAFGIGALPTALRLASAAVAGLRAERSTDPLARALNLRAALATQLGNIPLGESSAAEARQLGARTDQPRSVVTAELTAARAAAMGGDTRTAQDLTDRVEQALHPAGDGPMPALVHLVRGQIAAAAGEFGTAFDHLRVSLGPYLRFWTLPYLVETAVLGGRTEQLREIVAGLAPLRAAGTPTLRVGLAYADAVLADTEDHYLATLAGAELADWPFELARLQQAYGGWLRRHRRTGEARPFLRSAGNTFRVLGATPWTGRADAELRASGERMRPGSDARQALTPQELQIADLAAGGLSNREIATRLSLSPRTIDSHLYRIFRKLGVTSRTQLSELLAAPTDH